MASYKNKQNLVSSLDDTVIEESRMGGYLCNSHRN